MSSARDSVDAVQSDVCDFLEEKTEDGEFYFKGKFIADEVESSPRQLGAVIHKLQESYPDERDVSLSIEKWSYTSATTWRVVRQ